jgi:hypothetical protein
LVSDAAAYTVRVLSPPPPPPPESSSLDSLLAHAETMPSESTRAVPTETTRREIMD